MRYILSLIYFARMDFAEQYLIERKPEYGWMFSHVYLFPHLTVLILAILKVQSVSMESIS
jgi:hypothetical protein